MSSDTYSSGYSRSDISPQDTSESCDQTSVRSVISTSKSSKPPHICAKLIGTTKVRGSREAIALSLNKPVIIGRNPISCTYTIPDIYVSNIHCKIYVVESGSGGVIVSCQDVSTNGVQLNGVKIQQSTVLLMHGDLLEITPSKIFQCLHLWKAKGKTNVFEATPPTQPLLKRIGKFQVSSHCLGSGSFATVHLAMDISENKQYACKSVRVTKTTNIVKVKHETRILLALNHPNINQVVAVEEDGHFLHIFLQLCTGGDLFTYMVSQRNRDGNGCLPEGEAKYIMYQLLTGLKYLHDKMISHRDIKPENILLYAPGSYPRIQIADFGLARPKAYQETLNVCGTVPYLPPEGILALEHKDRGYVGMPADCWSAGIVLYIMLSGWHPFDRVSGFADDSVDADEGDLCHWLSQNSDKSEALTKKRIVDQEVPFPRRIWDALPEAKALVGRLLMYNHLHRATVGLSLESKWITSELEDLKEAYATRIAADID